MKIEVRKRKTIRRFNPAARDSDKAVYSRTPVGLRELFAAANEVPLAFFSFAAYCLGSGVIWTYFKSIGYIPDDISAFIGLSVFITVLSLLVVISIAALPLIPAMILRMFSLQLGTVYTCLALTTTLVILCVHFFIPDNSIAFLFLIAVAGTITSVFFLLLFEGKQIAKNIWCSFLLSVFAICPFLSALLVVKMTSSSSASDLKEWSILMVMLVIFTFANSALLNEGNRPWNRLKEWQKWSFAIFLNAAFILIALNLAPKGTFPTWAATSLGIRLDGIVELVIPENTCKTIQSRIAKPTEHLPESAATINCENFGNQVKAEVKVRLGRSWLVCVRELNGIAIDKPFSMTIPFAGTELIVKNKSDLVLANSKSAAKDDSCDFSRRAENF